MGSGGKAKQMADGQRGKDLQKAWEGGKGGGTKGNFHRENAPLGMDRPSHLVPCGEPHTK